MECQVHSLTTIPVELLLFLLDFLNTKSILTIASTCRRLREISYTAGRFRKVIESYQKSFATPEQTTVYLDKLTPRCHAISSWARYAYLEECIAHLRSLGSQDPDGRKTQDDRNEASIEERRICRLVSLCQMQMLSTKHPCLDDPEFTTFMLEYFEAGNEWRGEDVGSLTGRFLLSPIITAARLNAPRSAMMPTPADLHVVLAMDWRNNLDQHTLHIEDRKLFAGLELIGALTWAVNMSEQLRSGGAFDQPKPPTFTEIVLPSFMEQADCVSGENLSFMSGLEPSLVSKIAIPETEMLPYLTSSSWMGYYSYSFPAPNCLDRPMLNIRFTSTGWFESNGVGYFRLEAVSARDGVGSFTLSGYLNPKTGKLALFKHYTMPHGPRWQWHGMVTPFGIAAQWGSPHQPPGQLWGGWVWLWKDRPSQVM